MKQPRAAVPITALAPLLQRRSIWSEDGAAKEIAGLVGTTGLTLIAGRESQVAADLEAAMNNFVAGYRRAQTATPGEHAEWLGKIEGAAAELLRLFDLPPTGPGTPHPETVHALLRDGSFDSAVECYLRTKLAQATGTASVDEDAAARSALIGVQYLACRARLSIQTLEPKKGAKRKTETYEIRYAMELQEILQDATGALRRYTKVDTEVGGPLVRFIQGATQVLMQNLDAFAPDDRRDRGLFEALKKLTEDGQHVAYRIKLIKRLKQVG